MANRSDDSHLGYRTFLLGKLLQLACSNYTKCSGESPTIEERKGNSLSQRWTEAHAGARDSKASLPGFSFHSKTYSREASLLDGSSEISNFPEIIWRDANLQMRFVSECEIGTYRFY